MAEHMAAHVRESAELELLAEPGLSICCFRHVPPGVADAALDQHNERLLTALHHDGRAYLSNAVVDGRFALRACITNFRTTRDDVERTLALVCELGDRVAPQRR
jgi:glutamate/tyrosine decarboxylase-like PLP-dependent enzyme